MIVDTHSDINIYKDLVQGQMDLGDTNDRSEPSGCCGGGRGKNGTEGDLLECDFNEWAGESRFLILKPSLTFIQARSKFMRSSSKRNTAY